MKPHQERVILEKKELDKKLNKLAVFIDSDTYSTLDDEEQDRLEDQIVAMQDYSDVLGQRIEAFK